MRFREIFTVLAALVATPLALEAGTTYTNATAFLGVLQGPSFYEDFSGRSSPGSTTYALSKNGYDLTFSEPAGALLIFDFGDAYLTTSGWPQNSMTITFDPADQVRAFGGNIFVDHWRNGETPGASLWVFFSDGASFELNTLSSSTFWGYVSDQPLTSVLMTSYSSNLSPGLSSIRVGSVAAVPEGGSALLTGLASISFMGLRRRRA